MNLSNLFQKAKHWQLFLLMFGIPFTFQIIMMVSLFANLKPGYSPNISFLLKYGQMIPIFTIIFIIIFFKWIWAIAIGLQKKVPADVYMKTTKFKVFFFIPLIYILLFIGFGTIMIQLMGNANFFIQPSFGLIGSFIGIIFPLHFFSMFCIFYCLYFVAKTIRTIELQRECSFSDFAGEFFLIWFYPIGIWIIQPRINKIAEEEIQTPEMV